MKRGFGSDNHSGVSPEVLEAIAQANREHALAYGEDAYSEQTRSLFKQQFGETAEAYLVFNGTGANTLCIDAMTRSHEAVVCAETAHINVDECGSIQRVVGCRLLPVPTPDGKLTPALIQTQLHGFGFQHHSQPKVVSITQPTELGTLYTLEEIQAIAELAHANGMYLHMDGARLANAAVALERSFKEITTDLGVDALSFGGTKNGLMTGEAVVLLNPALQPDFLYRRKQAMQLCSKTRFLAVQFQAYFQHALWRKNAEHANRMAQLLHQSVKGLPHLKVVYPVQANGVFVQLPREVWKALQQRYFFYEWDESRDVVRWMCSFDTTEADIRDFVVCLTNLLQETPSLAGEEKTN
ncbi:MAG: low specificity L-threonine aldolase [Bacteroidales bacterium]|nr:low specificity L-threonine aldolase [Bacteroidales bacterium]